VVCQADEKERLEVLEEAGMTHRDGVHSELFNSGIPFINLHTALSLAILMLSASGANLTLCPLLRRFALPPVSHAVTHPR
jgi:hypothetical protein